MRKGPKDSSPELRRRPRPTPRGDDPARAGIRSLDCGEEMYADAPATVRREGTDAVPQAPADSGALGERRQSL